MNSIMRDMNDPRTLRCGIGIEDLASLPKPSRRKFGTIMEYIQIQSLNEQLHASVERIRIELNHVVLYSVHYHIKCKILLRHPKESRLFHRRINLPIWLHHLLNQFDPRLLQHGLALYFVCSNHSVLMKGPWVQIANRSVHGRLFQEFKAEIG